MEFDDIVIGAGLAGLGAVLGLLDQADRRIAVLTGPSEDRHLYYDERATVPCAYLGEGGLGRDWHGVIPMGLRHDFAGTTHAAFESLFRQFYPRSPLAGRLAGPSVFVPWRPIRPSTELRRRASASGPQRLALLREAAARIEPDDRGVTVRTGASSHRCTRVWLAAGALHTPGLMAASLAPRAVRDRVSDHVFCYLGQVRAAAVPPVERTLDGVFLPTVYDHGDTALYSLRPAVFDFRTLDHGIELRALFGLPTGTAVSKIARRLSPGLLAEALYNRFGLFGSSALQSAYAQTPVADAFEFRPGAAVLQPCTGAIRRAIDAARLAQPFDGLLPSRLPGVHLPGIHLHHTLDAAELARSGVNVPGSPIQVVDASVLDGIGPDHHSFKMMLAACERARGSAAQPPRTASVAASSGGAR